MNPDDLRVVVKKNPLTRQWRWKALAKNNEIVATGETYKNKGDAVNIAKDLFPTAAFTIHH